MSYPRNAATPPRIAVGAVVQISDGAVQTSGVSIRVVPQGGSAAAGLGTTTYEDGIVLYAPTQAETNYEAFCVIAYKTGCIPASTTVVTSASATAGYGGVDWSKVTSATTTLNLSGTTIKTATDIETDTQDIQSRLPAALVSGRMDSSVGAYQSGLTPLQPTVAGRTLDVSAGGEAGIDWANIGSPTTSVAFTNTTISTSQVVASVTGNVGGNVSGSVGSISGVTFPANFGAILINASGHISRVTLVDTTTTNTDMRGTDGAALASVWTPTVAGRIDAAISTRSSHSAADVWSVATRTLTAFNFSVTVGANNDKTGYSLATAPLDASGTAAAVWGASLSSYTSDTTFGGRILRTDQASSGNGAKVTGAGHVAADIHEIQPAVIQSTHFAAGAVDANALAADAASQIASAVRTNLATELGRIDATTSSRASQTSVDALTGYVDTEVAAIKAKTDNLPASPAAVGDIPTAVVIADAVLSRSVTNVEATAGEHTLCTLILAGLESSITGTTWTIRRTGGTTHYTKTVTTDSGAAPVVGVT